MSATDTLSRSATPARSKPRSSAGLSRNALASPFLAIDRLLRSWETRLHHRAQLRNMPEYLLRDVGIDSATAQAEADKPFWRS
jgi:uncharacterized protein YjiS (DUF1127 family)